MPLDQRLSAGIQPFLDGDERVRGGFVGVTGPRPRAEVVSIAVFGALVWAFENQLVAWCVGVAVFIAVIAARRYWTVVRTDRAVLLIDSGRGNKPRPGSACKRLPPDAMTRSNGAGQSKVTVGDTTLWLSGDARDEAARLTDLGP